MKSLLSRSRLAIRSPRPAAALYFVVVASLGLVIASSLAGILEQRDDVARAAATLSELERRQPAGSGAEAAAISAGTPFLEGTSATIAGATLLERVAGAVRKAGGKVLSTQLNVTGAPGKAGLLGMIGNFEVNQEQLQQLLYDLEAGMPLLLVDQLVVQAPVNGASPGKSPGNDRLQVRLSVSGQWRGGN